MDATTTSVRKGSDLCLPCGLCCEGVLHGHALLSADEIDQARRLGLRPMAREGEHSFSLPCPLYNGRGCPTYLDRPAVCCTHQCELLGKYLEGAIGLAAAVALVQEVKGVARSIARRIGDADPAKRVWEQAEEYFLGRGRHESEAESEQPQVELRQEMATLLTLCRRSFNPRGVNGSGRVQVGGAE